MVRQYGGDTSPCRLSFLLFLPDWGRLSTSGGGCTAHIVRKTFNLDYSRLGDQKGNSCSCNRLPVGGSSSCA
jgi:hypothetical protein